MPIETINPTTGELVERYTEYTDIQIDQALSVAAESAIRWKETSFEMRAALMRKAASNLRKQERRLGEILTLEMGKPILQAIDEVQKCAAVCDFYANNAATFLEPRIIKTDAVDSYVRYDPIGPVLAVMPWNFPFWQVYRFAAPALMAGNVAVLKHASNVPMAALEIEKQFLEAGFPEGLFTTLLISAEKTAGIIKDPRIKAVTLTGSEPAGRSVAATAGSVLKKTVLELGGSDPFIILPDADLEKAATFAVKSRMVNGGQSCIAAKRFIVARDVVTEFSELFAGKLEALKVGNPMDEDTDVGPMARPDLRDHLHGQVTRSVASGATLMLGGKIPSRPGYFYPVTLLAGVQSQMAAAGEETFGPVAPIIPVDSVEDAIAFANSSRFGLGGALWTQDLDRAHELVRQIESGAVFVNGMTKSDPRLPFGGVKASGYGRELSEEGIREFVNIKTVWMAN